MAQTEKVETDHKHLLLGLMHDLRRLGGILQLHIHVLKTKTPKESELRDLVDAVQDTADSIKARLDTVDATVNPDRFMMQDPAPRSIHKDFTKQARVLRERAKEKNVEIRIAGGTEAMIHGYTIFLMLPYLLLENAVKYSPKSHVVSVDFSTNKAESRVEIRVASVGPCLLPGEEKKLFDDGFRGKNAAAAAANGEGMGLKLALAIAQLHGGDVRVFGGPAKLAIASISYGEFQVTLSLPAISGCD